ncbi:MAG: 3-phosphoshikimate 1-carboxyvinyltransferase [Verrucomicrobiales bacterium]|jgi:3-phosphoshikimate 1-carboxyvinyltransferase
MTTYQVRHGRLINDEIIVPGDKSISHRAMMFAGLSDGDCVIEGFLPSEDCCATMNAMRALGVSIEADEASDKGFGPTRYTVKGCNGKLTAPAGPIDCGNSGTSMRLLSGILAGQPFESELRGDPSLSGRPMNRIITPLAQMNGHVESLGQGSCPPLRIQGKTLVSTTYELPVASAQVKSAVLLAGLFTQGVTTVIQPIITRDHTERMLRYFRIQLGIEGDAISIEGHQTIQARDFQVPGDISSAAFWLVAASAQKGSTLNINRVGLNPSRTGILKVLARMGASITENADAEDGEPIGDLEVRGAGLQGTEIGGDEIPNIIDELPVLAVAGALAEGTTVIRDAQELKVKETDRIHAVVTNLLAMGADVEERPDGMIIRGGRPLHGATLQSFGDHRIAMAFAIAGLFAEGQTIIEEADCVNTSYPCFEHTLKSIMNSTTPSV